MMPYYFHLVCLTFIVYGIAFNLAIKLGFLKKKDNTPFAWFLLAIASLAWPLSILVCVLIILVWVGSKLTDWLADLVLARIKGKKDAP